MNEESLNEIKQMDWGNLKPSQIVAVSYLIEQAERVQELEKRLKIYQKRSWFEDYEKVAKQNKRYREAIEEILAEAHEEAGVHPDTGMQLETYIVRIARKALEGDLE